jgi:Asp/Glu/hydantoin racemase
MRLLLANPNTNTAITDAMVVIARKAAPPGVSVEGATASFGEPLITDETALAVAAEAVEAFVTVQRVAKFDGVIIAAFGDPGLAALKSRLPIPATGLAEAGMGEGAAHGPFAVVTTTPDLAAAIRRTAQAYGHGGLFCGVWLTPGDPRALMADRGRLVSELEEACAEAVAAGARAIVIGGGPLAVAARALATRLPVPIVEPIPAAVRLAAARLQARPLTR